ncbi:MAG: RlmE family RNA methyltransferase [Deltaproteobacteria bacterium]|jgi:23S rRNA (uridine2552-2'-O)-methyltransferase|nr:RlmE family RNA methyltransferase [Deltaproteobacteria bacterium]
MNSKFNDRKYRHDKYYQKAKKENYLSRAVYKLMEIDKKHKLLNKDVFVLDLGCAPGSWSQYILKKLSSPGKLVAIDLKKINFPESSNFEFYQQDFYEFDFQKLLQEEGRKFDLVVSDMAPDTIGNNFTDCVRSAALVQYILHLAPDILVHNGNMAAKIFQGVDFDETLKAARKAFRKVKVLKPKGSRKESKEVYFVCLGFRQE